MYDECRAWTFLLQLAVASISGGFSYEKWSVQATKETAGGGLTKNQCGCKNNRLAAAY